MPAEDAAAHHGVGALEFARTGDLEALCRERPAVEQSVRVFAEQGDAASALELVGRAWRIWLMCGELDAGREAAAAALATPGCEDAPLWRARTLYGDGVLAFRAGDAARSLRRNNEALRVATDNGDVRGQCEALTGLARLALRDGRYEQVVELAARGRSLAQAAGDREAEAPPLHLHAAGLRLQRDYPAARELYLESLALNKELGNHAWEAMELDCLGWIELHLGNVDAAEARFRDRDRRLGSDPYATAWSRLTWAGVAAARGDLDEARRRYEDATRELRSLSNRLDPDDDAELDWLGEQLAIPRA